MVETSIIGVGRTPYGAFPDRSLHDLAAEACRGALADAGIAAGDVDAFYLGCFAGEGFTKQNHLAPYVGAGLGLGPVPMTHVEGACASGGTAIYHAVQAIAAGFASTVLVCGVEKMTGVTTPETTDILAAAGHAGREAGFGATFPALFAMVARRHMHQYGTTREQLSQVAVKNHANGALNPFAHMRKPITLEKAMAGAPVAEPLNLYDCSLISDGASAVVVTTRERARDAARPVRVGGIGQASSRFTMEEKTDITSFDAAVEASRRAYRMAGIGPKDVSLSEVHDCFTIAEIVAIEDLGFVKRGEGGPASLDGLTALRGKIPVNTSGGLKSKGHPVGATGVGQVVEVTEQLRGAAGERQVPGAEIGLTHNIGGSGATCVVTVLCRD
ncbi:MAG: thiolase domain-containing protein [Acidobacteriota bacterium]